MSSDVLFICDFYIFIIMVEIRPTKNPAICHLFNFSRNAKSETEKVSTRLTPHIVEKTICAASSFTEIITRRFNAALATPHKSAIHQPRLKLNATVSLPFFNDTATAAALKGQGIDPFAVLADNDSYHALEKCDGLIKTGATGTNVNDISVLLIKR